MRSSGSSTSGAQPYVDVRAFRRDDAVRFFGRDRESAEVAAHWRANSLTILQGPSGVGKSSLLAAGVLPLLDPYGADVLPIGRVSRRPSVPAALTDGDRNPLILALLASWAPLEAPTSLSGLTISTFLHRRPLRLDASGVPVPVMAAVDQIDDLFTAHDRQRWQCEQLLEQLFTVVDSELPFRLLVAVSDDHVDKVVRYSQTTARPYQLAPFQRDQALEACRGPAEALGHTFDPGAAETLIDGLRDETSGTVEPLLLQIVCAALLNPLPPSHELITSADLEGVHEAIADYCDRMLDEVACDYFHADAEKLRTRLLETFISATDEPELVYRGANETGAVPERAIKGLLDRHLLATVLLNNGTGCRIWHDRLIAPLQRSQSRSPWPGPIDRAKHLRLAESALLNGQYEVATRHARLVLRGAGQDGRLSAWIESFLGDAAYLSDDVDGALAHYRKAAQLYVAEPGAEMIVATLLTAVGRILIRRGTAGAAIGELRAAARRRPDDPVIQTELAWALWYSGYETGAVDVLDGVLAMEGNASEALRARGEIMSDLQRPDRALSDLQRVHPLQQSSTKAAYALALALSGNVPEAMQTIPSMEAEQDGSTLLRAARVMEVAGNHGEAVRLARRARQSTSLPLLPPRLAEEAERLGR